MSTTNSKRPTHRIKYEITGRDGKTVREIEIGAGWTSDGNGPLRLKFDVPPPAGTFVKVWPVTDEEKAA